ncbi:MAG: RluA family pseudouridine synthase [Sutterellaceae bacterium]|nr:RluA family pseudouridine synthase [Burkholderiaceae bacterium]MDW8430416.1 RluA family pseudouridine synthase [Sutterellaceae bacterium]
MHPFLTAFDDEDDVALAAPPAIEVIAPARLAGQRLDKALAVLLPQYSRTRIQQWIEAGAVRINGAVASARRTVLAGDRFEVTVLPAPQEMALRPEPLPLNIVDADETLVIIDKPPGLVVHPAAGHWSGTLANGLLAFDPSLARLPRVGIVHRLDAGTSGLMVVARTAAAQADLVRQLQARSVTREYWAIVYGRAAPAGTVDAPIGRDPRHPLRFMAGGGRGAREARTHWRLIDVAQVDGQAFSWLACRLETGRTHQIRVHLESVGLPLVGDPLYRRGRPPARGGSPWTAMSRQALHACRLALRHPQTGRTRAWFRAPPADLQALMTMLGFDGRRDVRAFE